MRQRARKTSPLKYVPLLRSISQSCVLLLILSTAALGQPSSTPTPSPDTPKSGQEAVLLEYARFLREEEKSHREYLEHLYTTTSVVLGLLVTIGVGLIGFFQFKTKKDVREAVDARFHQTVDQEFRRSMEDFKIQLGAAINQVNKDVDTRIGAILEGANQKFEELLFAAVPAQVEVAEAKPSATEEATPAASGPLISPEEQEILDLMEKSKYSFRSISGLVGESKLSRDNVRRIVDSLTRSGLLGKTLGKKGGDRWFITEAGRKYLYLRYIR